MSAPTKTPAREKPLIIEVDGRETSTTLRQLFIAHALDATLPDAKCGGCRNDVYYYALGNQVLYALGGDVVPPDTHHYPGKNAMPDGTRCDYSFADSGHVRHYAPAAADPDKARAEFFRPANRARTEAVLQELFRQNYSERVFDRLVEIMDQHKIWRLGFPQWSTGYVMAQLTTVEGFEFKTGGTADVRFIPTKDRKSLQLVRAGTEQPVHKHYPTYEVSESAANEIYTRRPAQMGLLAPTDYTPSFVLDLSAAPLVIR